jgi:tRNA G10  N-methylase Trm11
MLKTIYVLGRQPELSMAELESLDGSTSMEQFSNQTAVSSLESSEILIDRLGGTTKIAEIIELADSTKWPAIQGVIKNKLVELIKDVPEGRITLGLSVYGINVAAWDINNYCLSLKKLVKSRGKSLRCVPNTSNELSTAQTIHNKLTSDRGFEIIVAVGDKQAIIGRVTQVQDIYAYASRDQERPSRDAKVGMLPPKLAQIMINLTRQSDGLILDPFCGSGVVLQEALLMGFKAYGTDNSQKMVDYAQTNLKWLDQQITDLPTWKVELADARTYKWNPSPSAVVSETYLGTPLSTQAPLDRLMLEAKDVNSLVEEFLTNLGSQLNTDQVACVAIPAWSVSSGFLKLDILDHLEKIGYNHMSFKTVDTKELIYHRPGQLVARQILVLRRK